jgi:eukaryotic-like serine/threonine-protein kinase
MAVLSLRELCLADPVFSQRYEGWEVLGTGTYATVIRTRSRDAGRDIALKIFRDLSQGSVDRVREEVHAAQSLATPYFVQVYSVFDRGPIAWFEMELVDGPNLDEELHRAASDGHRFSLPQATEIALAVSRCLWHAHRRGVLHRDVKPANVLLPRAGIPAAKLADFGIARVGNGSGATPTGSITGTPRFASPEALAGEPVDRPYDVFGLCSTLYAIFSGGRLPFPTDRAAGIERLQEVIRSGLPLPLDRLDSRIDPEAARVINLGLALDSTSRPDVGVIVVELERAQRRGH